MDKELIIYILSGLTGFVSFIVIIIACCITPNQDVNDENENDDEDDEENENNNLNNNDINRTSHIINTRDIPIIMNGEERELSNSSNNSTIQPIIENYRNSYVNNNNLELENRNSVMITFTPSYLREEVSEL